MKGNEGNSAEQSTDLPGKTQGKVAGLVAWQRSSSRRSKRIVVLILIGLALVCGVILFVRPWDNQQGPTDSTNTEPARLTAAEELEQATFDDDVTDLDKSYHYRAVAAAYSDTDKQKSLEYLLMAEELTPDDKDLLHLIAVTYSELGDIENQRAYEQKAAKEVPQGEPGEGGCDISEAVCE